MAVVSMKPRSEAGGNGNWSGVGIGLCYMPGRQVWPEHEVAMMSLATPIGMKRAILACTINGICKARTLIIRAALENKLEYVLFVDDDVVPPASALCNLFYTMQQNPGCGAVSAVQVSKENPPQPLVWLRESAGPHWNWKLGDVFPVYYAPAGCLLVRMDAVRRLPEPWFLLGQQDGGAFGEDYYFCRKLIDAGFPVLMDGGIVCSHIAADGAIYDLPPDSFPLKGVEFTRDSAIGT